ncbi:MAG: hypothetical protein MI757_07865 [Pirellulales bacterium]|nr:hypothetical protein [Pirellulales bacterium]
MKKQDKNQLDRKLKIMRIAPWCVLAAVSLVTVPKYLDANDATTRLAGELVEAEALPGELASIQRLVETEKLRADELAVSLVSGDSVHDFHNRIVAIARKAGCKVRRMTEGSRNSKSWVPGQSIVNKSGGAVAGAAPTPGGLQLEVQEMRIEITGSLSQLKAFLDGFHETKAFVHTRGLSLSQPRGQDPKLELSLLLLNLKHGEGEENA